MTTRTKTFDCVQMKRQIQADLLAQYKVRQDEFASYAEFLRAKAEESPWIQKMHKRFSAPSSE